MTKLSAEIYGPICCVIAIDCSGVMRCQAIAVSASHCSPRAYHRLAVTAPSAEPARTRVAFCHRAQLLRNLSCIDRPTEIHACYMERTACIQGTQPTRASAAS